MSYTSFELMHLLPDKAWALRFRWIDNPLRLPKVGGLYILHLQLDEDMTITVGARGALYFLKGNYYYVGSAKGTGGLMTRIGHHWRDSKTKKLRWHIDYLRQKMSLNGCWVTTDAQLKECDLADVFKTHGFEVMEGLGSSDCQCGGHVFYQPFADEEAHSKA